MATRLVPALTRGLDILVLLAREPQLTAPAIAAALDLPRTTVHELVKTLEAKGFIQDAGGSAYRLGMRTFELGKRFERDMDLAEIGKQCAQRVADECGETVQIALLDGTEVIYVVQINTIHTVRLLSSIGGRLPAHLTGVGKVSLAFQDENRLHELYPFGQPLKVMTPKSIATTDSLHEALDRIRIEGVAWDECESNPDVFCVAAPVHNSTGAVIGGMSISVPATRWNDEHAEELRKLVVSGAQQLSANLGLDASLSRA
ncbi:IclR family transcriptional regulator [Sphaerisporangium sp. NPDC051011]|uniref:IclR family transcriptional regulator n=1 Tax=Sphaerisporangium sp. NPDC051011 TaxID=3155792 RepID=UPI003401DB2C